MREIFAGPTYLDVTLPAGGRFDQLIPRGHTGLLYVYQGEVTVGGRPVPSPRLAILWGISAFRQPRSQGGLFARLWRREEWGQ